MWEKIKKLFLKKDDDQLFPEGSELIPGWMLERMMSDNWYFGLLMVTGDIICISEIHKVYESSNGNIWADVILSEEIPYSLDGKAFISPTGRTMASINLSHVVAAFETADT